MCQLFNVFLTLNTN